MFMPMTTQSEWDWMESRAKPIRCEDSQGVVAYDGDEIQAAVVADSFTVDACSVHIAIDNPLVIKHGFLREVFRHLFLTCARERLFGLVPESNEKAIKFDTHIGFKEVNRIKDGYNKGTDYLLLRMDKSDCRWLEA